MALTREDLQAIAGLLQPVQEDIQELKRRTTAIEDAVQSLNQRTTNIELTLENETNRNIKLIAEGHLDLSRKLDDALKVEMEEKHSTEKELLLIRVNILKNELRKVKERLAQIA